MDYGELTSGQCTLSCITMNFCTLPEYLCTSQILLFPLASILPLTSCCGRLILTNPTSMSSVLLCWTVLLMNGNLSKSHYKTHIKPFFPTHFFSSLQNLVEVYIRALVPCSAGEGLWSLARFHWGCLKLSMVALELLVFLYWWKDIHASDKFQSCIHAQT